MTVYGRLGLCAALVLLGVAGLAGHKSASAALPQLSSAQSDYIEYCAGCHGIQGTSAPARIPQLLGRVGYFMCLPEGRDYLIRLPNVAHTAIQDPQELADMMNFIVFKLGKGSAPADAKPFTAEEVQRLRQDPLRSGASLVAIRAKLVNTLIRKCGAPESLREN